MTPIGMFTLSERQMHVIAAVIAVGLAALIWTMGRRQSLATKIAMTLILLFGVFMFAFHVFMAAVSVALGFTIVGRLRERMSGLDRFLTRAAGADLPEMQAAARAGGAYSRGVSGLVPGRVCVYLPGDHVSGSPPAVLFLPGRHARRGQSSSDRL